MVALGMIASRKVTPEPLIEPLTLPDSLAQARNRAPARPPEAATELEVIDDGLALAQVEQLLRELEIRAERVERGRARGLPRLE